MSSLTQPFIGVPELVATYRLNVFVETGVEDGVSTQVAHDLGLQLFGCDVDGDKVNAARLRFPQSQISHATSLDFLRDYLPRINAPALVWLDAHFSRLVSVHEQWPLREELELVAMLLKTCAQSVILADDFATVMHERLEDPDLTRFQGAPGFCDYTAADLCDMLPYHDFCVLAENTGVGCWTPRVRP